jgi:glycolate oxidase iron-sulfur subunit
MLRETMTSPSFGPMLKVGQNVRALLPGMLKNKVPSKLSADAMAHAQRWPTREHRRKVLMLQGCVQPTLAPNINSATARVLDAVGIQTVVAAAAGCCGALRVHLSDHDGGLADMRRNIDAWWPRVSAGEVEAIVMNASACGVAVKAYGHALAHEPAYAEKAVRISELTRDLSELLPELVPTLRDKLRVGDVRRLAFHPPCTLQHGQQMRGGVETHLNALGFDVKMAHSESYLCCGSAGTYSVLQPKLAYQLRDRKLGHLAALEPQCIVSANIGCIQHLQSGTSTPVKHWVEVLDEALAPG